MALTKDRAYSGGKFGLELDDVLAGWVFKVSGGGATADVVSEKIGPDHVIKKHLGGVKYEEIVVEAGLGMTKSFYQWIADSFDAKLTEPLDYQQSGPIISTLPVSAANDPHASVGARV